MSSIRILNTARTTKLLLKSLKADALTILSVLESDGVELSVSLVGDGPMKKLNRGALGHSGTTDVLSFPQHQVIAVRAADAVKDGQDGLKKVSRELRTLIAQSGPVPLMLGDIVICPPQAKRQAREQRTTLSDELRRLLVHGVSHLVGFDHERGLRAERAMHAFEDALLARLASRS